MMLFSAQRWADLKSDLDAKYQILYIQSDSRFGLSRHWSLRCLHFLVRRLSKSATFVLNRNVLLTNSERQYWSSIRSTNYTGLEQPLWWWIVLIQTFQLAMS